MSYLKINDLVFDVPASDISVDHVNQTFEWPATLRSRHATKIKTGKGDVLVHIRLQVFEHEQWKLHRLAVEFKYTPFWQIENQFLRDSIEPHLPIEQNLAFAAMDMNVGSVPGQPGFWNVDLSLKYFNYAPFLSNFQYKKTWIGGLTPNAGKWTIYSIPIVEDDAETAIPELDQESYSNSDDQTINQRIIDVPAFKLQGNAVDIGDLSPSPIATDPTSPVDCDQSDVYKIYINKLMWDELTEFGLAGSIGGTDTGFDVDPYTPPTHLSATTFRRNGQVKFRWTEYIYVEKDPEFSRLIMAATAARNPSSPTNTISNANAFTPIGEPLFLAPHPGPITSHLHSKRNQIGSLGRSISKDHGGTDIDGAIGDHIVAPSNGRITRMIEPDGNSAGRRMYMEDLSNPGCVHAFFHLNAFASGMSVGSSVTRGQVIAYMGNTGNVSKGSGDGSHLHWEIVRSGEKIDPEAGYTASQDSQEADLLIARDLLTAPTVDFSESVPEDEFGASIQADYTAEEIQALIENAKSQLDALKEAGWQEYRSPHVKNVYFKQKELIIVPSGTGTDGGILTGVGVSLNNRIVSIPLSGHQYPTMQHIGGYDNRLFMTFTSINQGVNAAGIHPQISSINAMISALESNARNFRSIPDSWTVDVETFATTLVGHQTYVVDRSRNDVGPGNPGMSTLELTLISTLKKPDEALVRSNNINREDAIRQIVKILLGKTRIALVEGRLDPDTNKPTVEIYKRYTLGSAQEILEAKAGEIGTIPPLLTSESSLSTISTKVVTVDEYYSTYQPTGEWFIKANTFHNSKRSKEVGQPIKPTAERIDRIQNTVAPGNTTDFNIDTEFNILEGDPDRMLDSDDIAVIDGIVFENGKERTETMPNVWQVVYQNTADPNDTFIYNAVNDLISLMQFASAMLSDHFYGGYTRDELKSKLTMYGMENYVLPSFETIDKSILGFQEGFGSRATGLCQLLGEATGLGQAGSSSILANSLRFSTRPLTAGKFKQESISTVLLRNTVFAPLNVLLGVGDLLATAGNFGDDDDPTFDELEQLSIEGSALNDTLVSRELEEASVTEADEQKILSEENQLIGRIEDIVDQYFNVVWLSAQGQANVADDSRFDRTEFQDIFERLTSDVLTSTHPCYPDLKLPTHPLFHGLDYGNLYTFPDFYFWNPAIDNGTERNDLESPDVLSQISTIVDNSYNAQKKFESGTLPKLGAGGTLDEAGAHFDGSDKQRNGAAYRSLKEYSESDQKSVDTLGFDEIRSQFVTSSGHSEISNTTGLFEPNPTLDHAFTAKDLKSMAVESLGDLQRYRGTMRRAFPTFKLFFVEEDVDEHNWRALDDFYSYNAIKSIILTRSSKVPADLCIVEMQNVSGALDGTLFGGIADVDYLLSDVDNDGKIDKGFVRRSQYRRPGFEETSKEDFFDSLVLREGMNVQLRLGYANHPDYLNTVFNGRVVEIAWSDNSDTVRVVCQSYAVELHQVEKGITSKLLQGSTVEDNVTLCYGLGYTNTTELLSTLIKSPECAHFGRWQFGVASQDEESASPELDPKYYATQLGDFSALPIAVAGAFALFAPPSPLKLIAGSVAALGMLGRLSGDIPNVGVSASSSMAHRRWDQLLSLNTSVFASDFKTSEFEKPYTTSDTMDGLRSYVNDLIGDKLGGVDPALESLGKEGISTKRFLQLKWRALQNDPRDDNIFAPHPTDYVDYGLFDYTGKITGTEIIYHVMSTTIWDVFQEMTYRHPGWVASPVPYGDRMTMFFGVPSQRYWARPASDAFINQVKKLRTQIQLAQSGGFEPNPKILSQYLTAIKLRFRPFRNYHLFTSYTDIVSNDISVSSHGVTNAVAVEYNATGFIDSFQDAIGFGNETEIREVDIAYKEGSEREVFILKYHPHMDDEDTYLNSISFENCNGKEMALRYAIKALCDGIKEMYKGTITVLGNSEIKPYDIGILFDVYNSMSGPFEIEEVTHFFSEETGFISVIVPKAVVIANEISSTPLIDSMCWGALHKVQQYWTSLGRVAATVTSDEDVSTKALAAITLGTHAITGGLPVGLGVNACVGGLIAAYSYAARDQVYVKNKDGNTELRPLNSPVTVLPLIMNNYPLVAGIPTGLAETRWTKFKGDWRRTFDDIESGFTEALAAANAMGLNVVTAYGPDMTLLEKGLITATRQ